MKREVGLGTLLAILGLCSALLAASKNVVAGFQKLQSLVGDWQGLDENGNSVKTSFRLIAANTAVMETLQMSGMEEMVTLYSVDVNAIALLHYCPTNNQPRMQALPGPGEVKQLVFSYQGAGNLPSLAVGHEHKLVIEFRDNDHITEIWTWRKNGKDTPSVYHFTRTSKK